MSRTRGMNEVDLWLFKKTITDTTNHIESTDQTIGHHFRANELNEKTQTSESILFGRGDGTSTVQRFITKTPLHYEVGDTVSEIESPNQFEKSTIESVQRKPIHKRGAKHNTTRQYVWILELS